jgi:Ni,Fe-hydrogenase III large subunit
MQRIDIRYNENKVQTVSFKWGLEKRPLWEAISKLPIDVAIKWVDRYGPFEAIASEWAVASAVEKALKIHVPERAEHLRAIYLEIQRVLWSFDYFARMFAAMGEDIRREEALRLREMVFEIQETLTGNRVLPQILRIGGIDRDLSLGESKKMKTLVQGLGDLFASFFPDAGSDPLLVKRLEDVLVIDQARALKISLRGPLGQASGVDFDLRTTHPLGLFQKYGIHCFEGSRKGDALARFRSVNFQILQSLKLLGLFLSSIPAGHHFAKDDIKSIPDGVWASAVESGPGALYAVVSGNEIRLAGHSSRLRPSLESLLIGVPADDFDLALTSLGVDFAQADLC